jgi:sulfoxide reductase heme-binding subunit YedZ
MLSKNNVLLRHLLVGIISVILTYLFWLSRPQWDPEMRFWRAVGDGSFILLWFTMAVGPIARYWPLAGRLLPWRRETGIWYGLLAFGHTYLVLLGWVRWDFWRFFGYEFVPELERYARLEPGFGLSNVVGMVAIFLTVFLVATSANWAVDLLGPSAWKWLQYGAYSVFYLVVLHTFYFLFMHYTISFHRRVPDDPNWFRYPFLILTLVIPLLQTGAFVRTVTRREKKRRHKANDRKKVSEVRI